LFNSEIDTHLNYNVITFLMLNDLACSISVNVLASILAKCPNDHIVGAAYTNSPTYVVFYVISKGGLEKTDRTKVLVLNAL